VESVYLLANTERRLKKNNEPFFSLQLSDATGTIGGIMWDGHAELERGNIRKDDYVLVQGDVGEFNGQPQITMRRIVKVDDADVDQKAFLPVSPRPREEMEAELDGWIARVKNPDCARLLARLFGHKGLRELYCMAPAAVKVHQAYIHGLLDHTLCVMKLAWSIADVYEPIDRDLLVTATLLHDIGKVRELEWKRSLGYTTQGRLLGHIFMGAAMVDAAINEIRKADGFDPEIQTHLIHLILSHHGKQEWGSPVTPKSREAFVLHYADHTEAYMASFVKETTKAAEKGDAWTAYSKMFESYLFVGGRTAETAPGGDQEPLLNTEGRRNPVDDVKSPT